VQVLNSTGFKKCGELKWQKIMHNKEILITFMFVKDVMQQTEVLLESQQSAENAKVSDLDLRKRRKNQAKFN